MNSNLHMHKVTMISAAAGMEIVDTNRCYSMLINDKLLVV